MKASIIIPTKNGGERFERLLKAVFENRLAGGFEVIVIDSGSTDGTIGAAKKYPVRLYEILPKEFGHGKVRNYGARLSNGESIVFLSQDAIPASKDWLANLVNTFNDDNNVAGVYGRQLPDGDNPMETFFLLNTYNDSYKVRSLSPDNLNPSLKEIFFSNVNSSIRRSFWEKFPFSEAINISEDQEWSKRVMLKGYKVAYQPEASVYHSHNYTISSIFKRNYQSGYSLKGLVKEDLVSGIKEVLSYISREMVYIKKSKGWTAVPYAFVYELFRHAGFAAGSFRAISRR